ncbi:MAG: MBL fold metallo-hydrolase [Paenibacillaceae bacterium]|nr:MBL fold metallo-hydrolase [Paenibacillaceae bacterium]
MITAISERLYVYEDTCRVYVVKHDEGAVLIDFGSGAVLDELAAIGVERVTDILMTHHHRDQGQGLARAEAAGIAIRVPHQEQDLFAGVDSFWQGRSVVNNYNVRQDRFSLLEPVRIAGTLKDYATLAIGGVTFTVVPTPGHTFGSVTLLAEVDGVATGFIGDLIAAPGKLWSLAATQWTYNGGEGIPATIVSLLDLKERRRPQRLLPSHGAPIDAVNEAVDLTVARLTALMRGRGHNPRLFEHRDRPYVPITPHLLKARQTMCNYYVLLSDSGKALLLDFGYDFLTGIPAGADRASRRPWLYSLPALKEQFGVTSIDVALPTHYHDDHVAGFNLLRETEGTEVWAAASFADVLRHPERYDLPCLWYDPIPVDRELPLETPFRWEEYEFTLHSLPGHTLYAVAIAFEADGRKVVAAGDQYQGDDGLQWNYVYANRFRIGDYRASAALYRRLRPDVILTGHWEPLWVKPGYFDSLEENGEALERLHRELLPLEEFDFGAEGFAARIEPYQTTAAGGETMAFAAEIRNPFGAEEEASIQVVAPSGWTCEPATATLRIPARGTAPFRFRLTAPAGTVASRARIAVDVTVGGRRFGQQAEALVTLR